MVKVFTMVRDEDDIVYEWVLYHGTLFGFQNVHVIDNLSRDHTWTKLKQMRNQLGITIYRCRDYRKKGDFMTLLMRRHARAELVFPLDIDEFIVLLDDAHRPTSISCKNPDILAYLRTLPIRTVYKMPYLNAILTEPAGYECAPRQTYYAQYSDIGAHCKSFVFYPKFQGKFDHGNHLPTGAAPPHTDQLARLSFAMPSRAAAHSNDVLFTRLALVHYHTRNWEQQRKKTENNVRGLGYPVQSAEQLSQLLAHHPPGSLKGEHHIHLQLSFLNGTYQLPTTTELAVETGAYPGNGTPVVSLVPLIAKIDKCEQLLREHFLAYANMEPDVENGLQTPPSYAVPEPGPEHEHEPTANTYPDADAESSLFEHVL